MDFSVLPPEINSARMYSGPGSGPLMAAATAWDELATELDSTAASYSSVISGLTGDGVAGPLVGVDGGRGRALCGLDEHYRRTG